MNNSFVRIGTVGYPVNKKLVYAEADVVELTNALEAPPKQSTGEKLRQEAPYNVVFTVQLPRYLCETPSPGTPLKGSIDAYGSFESTDENMRLMSKALRFAKSVQAQSLVLLTPPEFTPSKVNTDALARFLSAVDFEGRKLIWEPRGPWESEYARAFALELGITLAVDPLRDDPVPGEIAYFRLGPFATMGTRMGLYDLSRLKEAMSAFEQVFCVFQTDRALDDARNLKKILEEEQ